MPLVNSLKTTARDRSSEVTERELFEKGHSRVNIYRRSTQSADPGGPQGYQLGSLGGPQATPGLPGVPSGSPGSPGTQENPGQPRGKVQMDSGLIWLDLACFGLFWLVLACFSSSPMIM